MINYIVSLIKILLVAAFKTIITFLNLVPLAVYEVHGRQGMTDANRPDIREVHNKIKGRRRAHLGSFILAWCRGAVFKAHLNREGVTCWGVYAEDYQDIQKKWVW